MKRIHLFFVFTLLLALGTQAFSQNLAYKKPVKASRYDKNNPPELAVDGNRDTWWSAGTSAPQWIEVDLQAPVDIERINLVTSQYPDGETLHKVWGKPEGGQYQLLHEFNEKTTDNQDLTFLPDVPWVNIQYIKIETTKSPSWIAWRGIEIYGVSYHDEFIKVAGDSWHFETETTGRPFIPFGVNYYDPGSYHDTPYSAFDVIGAFDSVSVDRQLAKIHNLGANIIRIFLSVVSFEPDLFVLNESSFQKLDKLIKIAKKHRLRIIFDVINDWEGDPGWQSWDYYADETTLQGYEFYLEALGARYKDEPAIFSWSLQNEPYVRGPSSGIMGDLWIPYTQFKYGSEANLSAAWSDYPQSGETWDNIKQPEAAVYDPLNTPGDQRLYDYQLFREDIAYNWVRRLSHALRLNDPKHMISIGLDQHSVPIKNAVPERTYTGFNPRKIAHFLDYTSIHAYNWWDASTVSTFIEAIARYSFANKPVVVEEYNLREAGSTVSPLLDSSSGWLHWAAFATEGFEWNDNLFDLSENVTPLGQTFRSIADTIYNTVPTRAPDVAWLDIDLKQALTSVDYQNTRFPEYVSLFNSSGGPVGFTVRNYQPPLRLGLASLDLPTDLVLGQQYNIGWIRLNLQIIHQPPVSLQISRDGGDQWETIATGIKEDAYSWKVSGPVSDQCLFRVADMVDTDIYAVSTKKYSIIKPTSIKQNDTDQPLNFSLSPAYPNPFNPATTIGYQLSESGYVNLSVYNMNGRLIRGLVQETQQAGRHRVRWNATDDQDLKVSSGIYLYRLKVGKQVLTNKMLLLK